MSIWDIRPDLLGRQLLQPFHVSPIVGAILTKRADVPELDVIGIYRRDNAATLRRLIDAIPEAHVSLWALDAVADTVRDATIGSGAGSRTELVNRLEHQRHAPGVRWLLMADDDVAMPIGQLRLFLRLASVADLDISQPAHLARSYASWRFNRQRIAPLVRLTRFVEPGPIVLFSPRARQACIPLPEELGMGWGLEAHFAAAANDGRLRLGVVDAVGMRHLKPVSMNYRRGEAESIGRQALARSGVGSYATLQVETERWPLWKSRPSWIERQRWYESSGHPARGPAQRDR